MEVERPVLATSLRQGAHLERHGDSEEMFDSMYLFLASSRDLGVLFWTEGKLGGL